MRFRIIHETAALQLCHCLVFISAGTIYYILCDDILTHHGKDNTTYFLEIFSVISSAFSSLQSHSAVLLQLIHCS